MEKRKRERIILWVLGPLLIIVGFAIHKPHFALGVLIGMAIIEYYLTRKG